MFDNRIKKIKTHDVRKLTDPQIRSKLKKKKKNRVDELEQEWSNKVFFYDYGRIRML